MRNLAFLSLALNFLLIGFLFYTNTNNYSIPKSTYGEGVIKTEQIISASQSYLKLVGSLTDTTNTTTRAIELGTARLLHRNFLNNRNGEGVDSTRSIAFNLRVLLNGLYTKTADSKTRDADFVNLMLKTDINCYLAKYPSQNSPEKLITIQPQNQTPTNDNTNLSTSSLNINSGQTTLILQLSDGTVDTIYPGQTYNYGAMCPKNCLIGLLSLGNG